MNVEKKENIYGDSCTVEIIKISTTNKPKLLDVVSKEYVDNMIKETSEKLARFEKLTATLRDRVKNIEKDIVFKDLGENLNKHYEQMRRY